MPVPSRLLDLPPSRALSGDAWSAFARSVGWSVAVETLSEGRLAWTSAHSAAFVRQLPAADAPWTARLVAEIDAHVAGLTPRVEVVYMSMDDRWMRLTAAADRSPSGSASAVRGLVQDVDDAERGRQRASEAERWLRGLIDQLPEAVVVWREGAELLRNARADRLLGDRRSLGGLLAAFGPDERARLLSHLAGCLPDAEPQALAVALEEEAGPVWLELSSSALQTDDGPAVLSVIRDVTEQRTLELEAAAQNRMATVGTLAAGVAHEINNPLCFMQLNLEMLREDLPAALAALSEPGDPAATEAARADLLARLEDVLTGAGRVREVVSDLKVFSHGGAEESAVIDAGDAVRLALNLGRHQVKHRAEVELRLTEPLPVVAHLGRLSQVFLNLLVNAAQAIGQSGRGGRIRISARKESGRVRLVLEDDGPGVPVTERARIFDPFFTSKDVGEGTGLGLSISRNIIRGFGGSLSLADGELGGAAFALELPLAPAVPVAAVAPAERADDVATAPPRRTLLVADDEALLLSALQRRLRGDFDVRTAADGQAVLAQLSAGATPDALLLDVMMPGVDGAAVFDWIQRHRPELEARVVFMTGGAVTPATVAFLERVPNLTVGKPLDMDALVRSLHAVLDDAPAVEAEPDLLERRRAPRVPAPALTGCLTVGPDAHRVDIVDLSAVGLCVRGGVEADAGLMLEPLSVDLVHATTRERATLSVRCVRSRGVDGGGELGLELLSVQRGPEVYQAWAAAG